MKRETFIACSVWALIIGGCSTGVYYINKSAKEKHVAEDARIVDWHKQEADLMQQLAQQYNAIIVDDSNSTNWSGLTIDVQKRMLNQPIVVQLGLTDAEMRGSEIWITGSTYIGLVEFDLELKATESQLADFRSRSETRLVYFVSQLNNFTRADRVEDGKTESVIKATGTLLGLADGPSLRSAYNP